MKTVSSFGLQIPLILAMCFIQVFCQVKISASEGQTVVLPCTFEPVPGSTLIWTFQENNEMLTAKGNDIKTTDNRVETFPKEHSSGNFSLKISDVRVSDSGSYQCYQQPKGDQSNVELTVTERKQEETTEKTTESPVRLRGGAAAPLLSWLLILPSLLLSV